MPRRSNKSVEEIFSNPAAASARAASSKDEEDVF
jgi:hypothetical protein